MKHWITAITEYLTLTVLLFTLIAMAGCGETGPGDAVEDFLEAALDKDCAAMVDLSSAETLGGQTREEAVRDCEESGELTSIFSSFEEIELESFETLEEDIKRDKATVKARITVEIGDREEVFEETFLVMLEDEDWKVRL